MTKIAERVDVAALVGQMPEVACEGQSHGRDFVLHDDGPGRHYFQSMHDCSWTKKGAVYVRCQKRSEAILRVLAGDMPVFCMNCRTLFEDRADWQRYVGPVRGGK